MALELDFASGGLMITGPHAATVVMDLIAIASTLAAELSQLRFGAPVSHVYNPLEYAWANYATYLERFGAPSREVILIGMNPGPWGMVQTGVPFGDPHWVRDWMGISGEVRAPAVQHPKRPILGFECPRGEISGQRLWGWARERYLTAEAFFTRYLVLNYCPFCFLEQTGRNRTPDKLPRIERKALFEICDRALARSIEWVKPQHVVGIGRFATERARCALGRTDVGCAPHPSPANPNANRDWARQMNCALAGLGVAETEP
jgi:single-strand selective monofunctional uracil DNA glycosylase